jgi:hypothetical protein
MVPKLCDRYEFVYALINDFPHLKFTLNGGIDNIHQVCLFLHLFYKVVPLKTLSLDDCFCICYKRIQKKLIHIQCEIMPYVGLVTA